MGRSKTAPKRRRPPSPTTTSDAQKRQREAVSLLQTLPQPEIEKAATSAIRSSLTNWNRLLPASPPPESSPFFGLGRCTIQSPSDFSIMTKLHENIKNFAPSWTSWSGSPSDPRRRAFGFLPETIGYDKTVRELLDVSKPEAKSSEIADKERKRNEKAMAILTTEHVPDGFEEALERLLSHLRDQVPSDDVKKYLTMSQLVAAQPNLHRGQALLPCHVDHPTKDGFGVVIVTVGIKGRGEIMLESKDREETAVFCLKEGDAYMLSGDVRNKCTHGVLADDGYDRDGDENTAAKSISNEDGSTTAKNISNEDGSTAAKSISNEDGSTTAKSISNDNERRTTNIPSSLYRESLNFRFGLHGRTDDDPSPNDVIKHWHWD